MSNQVYSSEAAAAGKIFIDQRMDQAEAAIDILAAKVTAPGNISYYTGATSATADDANIAISGLASDSLTFLPTGIIEVDTINPASGGPGTNYVTIAGINVGSDAPTAITIAAPVAAVDANALLISGSDLKAQYADGVNPGIVSTGNQTFAGAKTFATGIYAQNFTSSTGVLNIGSPDFGPQVVTMNTGIGGSLLSYDLEEQNFITSVNGYYGPSIDNTGLNLAVGASSGSVTVGGAGINTTMPNGIFTPGVDTSGAATLTLGGTNATAVTVGQIGVPSDHPGGVSADTIDVRAAGAMTIGATATGAVSISQLATPTQIKGALGCENGLTAAGIANLQGGVEDIGATLELGTVSSTAVTIGKVGITTNIPGTLQLPGGGQIASFQTSTATQSADGAIPVTGGAVTYTLTRINNTVTACFVWNVGNIVATSAGSLTMQGNLPAAFRPATNRRFSSIILKAGTNFPGVLNITSLGDVSWSFIPGTNGGNSGYLIGESASFDSSSANYDITV